MDANVTQLFQWCDAVLLNDQLFENNWYCQRCHNKQFLNPVWVLMANKNNDNETLVVRDYQGHFYNVGPR